MTLKSILGAAVVVQLAAVPGVEVGSVEIPSFDGSRLSATYYDPGVGGPGVVFFRNCDENRASMDGFARKLAERGAHVVVYDYRGGVAAGRSWRDTRIGDADRVYAWLSSKPAVDRTRLAAVAGSCGVTVSLDFAASHADHFKGVVVLSGPSDSAQRAFITRTSSIGILGALSVEEGPGVVSNIEPIVKASSNKASRMIILKGAGHGTEILKGSASFEKIALDWLAARLSL
ncbi:MAG TPA: alpha/beta fold hydrolase [Gemmatimonadaceae bacterium]|nr:alpha/beta fold hydrolase [Gemmatimonadaceae bacterium]